MFEVVNGRVVRAVHVSTGLTGNTPVGRFRVYRLGPGYNALGMYYSLYFLRGFAIHGYRSVPPWPASHGCIRTPIWFAPGFYRRWARLGTEIRIFP
jgi:lipoprotein-anchoring transpeptidase ErfK/SrfK